MCVCVCVCYHSHRQTDQGSAFFRLFRFSGFLELNWTLLEISANLMRKSYDPPPTPLPTLGGPKSLRIRDCKVGFSKFSVGDPQTPSYRVVTFMHVALLALFFVLATTLRAFQAFWSSVRQTPVGQTYRLEFWYGGQVEGYLA